MWLQDKYVLFLSLLDHLYELVPSVALLLCSEVFVDWVKHAFITKFNCISSEVCQYNVVQRVSFDSEESSVKTKYLRRQIMRLKPLVLADDSFPYKS